MRRHSVCSQRPLRITISYASLLWAALLCGCAAIDRSAASSNGAGAGGQGMGGRAAGGDPSFVDAGSGGTDIGSAAGEDDGASGAANGGAPGAGAADAGSGGDSAEAGRAEAAGAPSVGSVLNGSQELVDLADGYYSLSALTMKSGVGNCYISVKDYGGGSERMTSLPVSSEPTTLVVRGVHVLGGRVTIGAYSDANATDCVVGSARLEKDDVPYLYLKGGDATEVTRTEDSGAIYRETDGAPKDPFQILVDHGYNMARLRLYNDPGNPDYFPSREMPPYAGPEDVLKLAKRAKDVGLMIELTFHYSDYWTNAGTQCLPHEWSGMTTFAEVKSAMVNFTQDFMAKMAAQGTTPEYVSIGNESNGGLLYPFGCAWSLPASDKCPTAVCTTGNWAQLGELYGAAYDAVKAVSPTTQVIIHLAYQNGAVPTQAAGAFNSYFAKVTANGGKYDIKGLSYYPFWTRSKVTELEKMVNLATAGDSPPVLVMETGYNWNPTRQDGTLGQLTNNGPAPYPSTPAGQKDFLLELSAAIKRVNGGKCIGSLYWDPMNIIENSQVSNTAMFDFGGKALPALDAYQFND